MLAEHGVHFTRKEIFIQTGELGKFSQQSAYFIRFIHFTFFFLELVEEAVHGSG